MSWATDLYPNLSDWREQKFPSASARDIALKLGEEAGEVQAAVFKNFWEIDRASWLQMIPEEVGDLGLTLLSLCEYFDLDLCEVIIKRAKTKGILP